MAKKNSSAKKMFFTSALMFSFSFILFISVTVAWFAYINNVGDLDVVVANPEVTAELYYEQATDNWVVSTPTDPLSSFIYKDILPNQYFRYKLELRNSGTVEGPLAISLNNFTCVLGTGGKCVSNRLQIQNMSLYSATYVGSSYTEGTQITTTLVGEDKYLAATVNDRLVIFEYANLQKNEALILYFYIWFNPEYAYNIVEPEVDSNDYATSHLTIASINISLDQAHTTMPPWGS